VAYVVAAGDVRQHFITDGAACADTLVRDPRSRRARVCGDESHAVEDAAAALSEEGKKFKIVPQRLLYSLQWKHNAHPPDFHLSLVQEHSEQWVNAASLVLLGELRRRAPEAIDWTAMGDVVPMLDAFEAAIDSRAAHRH
jgi:hypothetical protein